MFTLKNVKYAAFQSHETHCYQASLYLNGKKVANVSNEGHGGPEWVEFVSDEAKTATNDALAAMPKHKCSFNDPKTGEPAYLDMTLEFVCGDLMDDWLAAKELKRLLAKRVLWTKPGEPGIYQTQCAKNKATLQHWVDEIAGDVVDIVLNNEPFEDALAIFKERT